MTEREIQDCFFDLEIHQKSIDALVDHLHELISEGKISDAKIVADRIREMQMG
jgi:hypothetical protein